MQGINYKYLKHFFSFQSLHKILSKLPPDDPKSLERQKDHNPSVFQTLLTNNFNMAAFLPHFTSNTFDELRCIVEDTIRVAANSDQTTVNSAGLRKVFIQLHYYFCVCVCVCTGVYSGHVCCLC